MLRPLLFALVTAAVAVMLAELLNNIEVRRRTEEKLAGSHQQLRQLAARLQSVREEEKRGVARELDDMLGQLLAAVKMDLSWLSRRLPKDQTPLVEKTKAASRLVDSAIRTVRSLHTELRPPVLDDFGLGSAIEWQAEEFQKRTGVESEVSIGREDLGLDRALATAVFRVFQEALTNVTRHASAAKVSVRLREDAGKLLLEISDDGRGITKKHLSNPRSLGLAAMRERVLPWGGAVKITGRSGKRHYGNRERPARQRRGGFSSPNKGDEEWLLYAHTRGGMPGSGKARKASSSSFSRSATASL